jgi:rhodanese-related sulfurtransferase
MDAKTTYERRDEVQLVDVREPDEWEAGRIEGAVHIPMREISVRRDELAEDRPIVTVCRSGARAGAVTDALKRAGYEADTLDGGMQAWARNGLPFVSDSASEPRVA